MFRHVVMFRWSEEAGADRRDAAVAALGALPGHVMSVRAFTVGSDARVNEGNFDLVVVADFDDAAGYLAYRDHPAHQAVVRDHLLPIIAERAAVQCEVPG
jgi:hypothetical protein